MNFSFLLENLSNPALLFFVLGLFAVYIKSDLELPDNSSKFISLYLLLSIGFKGGQALAHEVFTLEILWLILFGIALASLIPILSFFILKFKFNIADSAAIAAAYGSVSAVTFVTADSFLESQQLVTHGYMVAIMALMEAPAIIMALLLVSLCDKNQSLKIESSKVLKHSLSNGSVVLILGSLFIGFFASSAQAEGIKPFTTDLFKGFLSIFLLDMGIRSGKKINSLFEFGWFPFAFSVLMPLSMGVLTAFFSSLLTEDIGNRFILAILASSASYIAVPAAMKISLPKANPGLYLPMALAITFPFNITLGFPIYYACCLF